MGFKRKFEDGVGNIYESSYWYPTVVVINKGTDSEGNNNPVSFFETAEQV